MAPPETQITQALDAWRPGTRGSHTAHHTSAVLERNRPGRPGTTLHAPHIQPGTVRRSRLTDLLVLSCPALVTLVAPPGFGKTALLAEWHDVDARPFAWVTVDANNDDPAVLWSDVHTAVSRACGFVDIAERVDPIGMAVDVRPAPIAGPLEDLEAYGDGVVLVIDDYHLIRDVGAHASVEEFLRLLPENVVLVLSGRSQPPIPLGRLRAGGRLMELSMSDLALTADETGQLLNGALDLRLDHETVALLHQKTEGWPAGLSLAAASMRASADRSAFAATFDATNRHVADYLNEQVVLALDPDDLGFLSRISILDRVSGPLADAVTGEIDSARRLADLERASTFLVGLDEQRAWYRFHRLFGQLLRVGMERREPESVRDLHLRASTWFEAAGDADRAIRHAVVSGDRDRASRLISEQYLHCLQRGDGLAEIQTWLDLLDPRDVENDPRLCIVNAWLLNFGGRHSEGRRALERAKRSGYEGSMPDGASSIEATASLLGAAFPGGDVARMVASARRAYELEGDRASPWRATVHVMLGFALVRAGRWDDARPYLERGRELAVRAEQWMDAVGARTLLARVALETGDHAGAEERARDAVALAEARGLANTPAGAYATMALGMVLAGRGRSIEGDQLLTLALDPIRAFAEPLSLGEVLLALASVRHARREIGDALDFLREAEALIEACPDPGVLGGKLEALQALVDRDTSGSGLDDLSAREIEVLALLARGATKREAARVLFISYNTVHTHARQIYRKLGASSREQALTNARARGLID